MFTWASLKRAANTVLWVPPLIAFNNCVYSYHDVGGDSMQPTLNPAGEHISDRVIVERWPTWLNWYKRGDVVLLKCAPSFLELARALSLLSSGLNWWM